MKEDSASEGVLVRYRRRGGIAIVNSDGKQIPVRYVGEQHVREDLGRIPTAQDWLFEIKPQRWMYGQRLDDEDRPREEIVP